MDLSGFAARPIQCLRTGAPKRSQGLFARTLTIWVRVQICKVVPCKLCQEVLRACQRGASYDGALVVGDDFGCIYIHVY